MRVLHMAVVCVMLTLAFITVRVVRYMGLDNQDLKLEHGKGPSQS